MRRQHIPLPDLALSGQVALRTYIPNLLNSIGPIEFNRAVGLKIEDASENFPRASSIFNPTALLNSIGPIELNRVQGVCEESSTIRYRL